MSLFVDRLSRWYSASLGKLRQRNWKAWAIVVATVFVVAEVIRAAASDAGTLLLVWLYRGLTWFGRQPMGVGGLVIVSFLLLLMAAAWWETRPRKEPPPAKPPPMPEAERRLVQDIRTVWGRHGHPAVDQLQGLIRDCVYELENRVYWAALLRPIATALEVKQQDFVTAIDPGAALSINAVRTAFNAMYGAYFQAMKWLALVQAREDVSVRRHDERFAVWRQNHKDMINRLYDLEQDPAHQGTLAIHSQWIDEPEFRSFLTDVQYSEEWLALIRQDARMPGGSASDDRGAPASKENDDPI